MSQADLVQQIALHVNDSLKLPTEDSSFSHHIASILSEEPPISGLEVYEMISDFFEIFQINRTEAVKKCELLFSQLKSIKGYLKSEDKYKLTAEQLGKVVILEDELKL